MIARLLLAAVCFGPTLIVGCQSAHSVRPSATSGCAIPVPDPEFYGHSKTCWRPWNDATWSHLCCPACIESHEADSVEILELLDAPREPTDDVSPPGPIPPPMPAP